MSTSLAIFVKTPGVSPLKTRLAHSIGQAAADSFFKACIKTVEKTALEVYNISGGIIQPYWAVGERESLSHSIWQNLPSLYTGPGSLGERLHTVYSSLIGKNDSVLLMGADSPQITAQLILSSNQLLFEGKRFIIGPAVDGGFYLFGGTFPITRKLWTGVNYGTSKTMAQLVQNLGELGRVKTLQTLVDVDVVNDLNPLVKELKESGVKLQLELANWVNNQLLKEKVIKDFTFTK